MILRKYWREFIYPSHTVKENEIVNVNHLFLKNMLVYSKIYPRLRKIIYVNFDAFCSADMYPLRTSLNYIFLKLLMLLDYFDLEFICLTIELRYPKLINLN